ncbi:proton-coupled zinc antiporter SLC30A9, mitochondrial [Eupeodes corollae]|uniref:proton-coupled zinc antiporter SLC30A9, mitochondrial n=1 Tax=Eupeodes corollae TaxID=290404 RepID=UPI002493571D|nr:proton-coupled zinc antiporter SLC30A9, mitochondrial [Eupeodes corollae]XP_055906309.1 proton-coupled zinc antiporter SLC30A9, mitochondrial [Eupeodes corollae]
MLQRSLEVGRILRNRYQVPRILKNKDNNQNVSMQIHRLYSSILSGRHPMKNCEARLSVILKSYPIGIKHSNPAFYATSKDPDAKANTPAVVSTPSTPSLPITTTASATVPPIPKPNNQQTTKLEVKTKKGVLSVTTTIEDSKLNEVVFEKEITQPNANAVEATKVPPKAVANVPPEEIKPVKPQPKKRTKFDSNRSSMERNFITPARAMTDFLLKPSDLEALPKIKRRSPYEQEPPITVYWRKDVEAKAIEVWGSKENLLREILKREIERKRYQQNIFTVKRRLRDYRREIGSRTMVMEDEPGLRGKSGRVVLIAIGINTTNFIVKTFAWLSSGSHSMFAEAVHSLADTINQLILAYGIHKSTQMADPDHPYGYTNMKYVSSLISGVGIFCVGTGISIYHGITGLIHPEPVQDYFWAFCTLGGSMLSEGATLMVAMNEVRRSAANTGMSFKDYVLRGKDPCVNVVLTEDTAAVSSVAVAATCMALSSMSGSHVPDAVGSLLIGGILGAVASFIIYTNVAALVGRSISQEHLNKINCELENDVMIRAIHDVKGIDMGNSLVRYKAEIDFDGRELTKSYLDKQELNELLKAVKSFQTVEELELFLLTHGENIVDLMGGEIDRIEMRLRKKFPELRHCDLEIL